MSFLVLYTYYYIFFLLDNHFWLELQTNEATFLRDTILIYVQHLHLISPMSSYCLHTPYLSKIISLYLPISIMTTTHIINPISCPHVHILMSPTSYISINHPYDSHHHLPKLLMPLERLESLYRQVHVDQPYVSLQCWHQCVAFIASPVGMPYH